MLHELLVEAFVDFHKEGRGFLLDLGVTDLQDDLDEGLDADELEVEDLQLRPEGRHDLPILLVHMDEEVFEASIDGLGEEAEVELEERVEEKQLKAVIREEVVAVLEEAV